MLENKTIPLAEKYGITPRYLSSWLSKTGISIYDPKVEDMLKSHLENKPSSGKVLAIASSFGLNPQKLSRWMETNFYHEENPEMYQLDPKE